MAAERSPPCASDEKPHKDKRNSLYVRLNSSPDHANLLSANTTTVISFFLKVSASVVIIIIHLFFKLFNIFYKIQFQLYKKTFYLIVIRYILIIIYVSHSALNHSCGIPDFSGIPQLVLQGLHAPYRKKPAERLISFCRSTIGIACTINILFRTLFSLSRRAVQKPEHRKSPSRKASFC